MRVTLVAGLPGSGKSWLLAGMAADGAVTVDDPRSLDELPRSPVAWLAVADPNFCSAHVRASAGERISSIYPSAEIEWVFFENDPAACASNAASRPDGRNVAPDIDALSARYEIPAGADVRPVYGAARPTP